MSYEKLDRSRVTDEHVMKFQGMGWICISEEDQVFIKDKRNDLIPVSTREGGKIGYFLCGDMVVNGKLVKGCMLPIQLYNLKPNVYRNEKMAAKHKKTCTHCPATETSAGKFVIK